MVPFPLSLNFPTLHTILYYTLCALIGIQSLSLSLFTFPSCSHTLGRKWGKVAIEFPFSGGVWNRKKFRAIVLASISRRHWTQPNPFLWPPPSTHTPNPLHFIREINYFISFSVRSIFIRLCGAPQLLSLWRALMNVLGSHPLIIPALNAFRYTLASSCLQCT